MTDAEWAAHRDYVLKVVAVANQPEHGGDWPAVILVDGEDKRGVFGIPPTDTDIAAQIVDTAVTVMLAAEKPYCVTTVQPSMAVPADGGPPVEMVVVTLAEVGVGVRECHAARVFRRPRAKPHLGPWSAITDMDGPVAAALARATTPAIFQAAPPAEREDDKCLQCDGHGVLSNWDGSDAGTCDRCGGDGGLPRGTPQDEPRGWDHHAGDVL